MAIKIKTHSFDYTLIDVELSCELEFEPGCKATYSDPADPAYAVLHSACVGDVNIYEILSDEQKAEIEAAFVEQSATEDDGADDYYRDQRIDDASWRTMNEFARSVCVQVRGAV